MTHLELVPVPPVAQLAGVSQHYGKTVALNNITLDIPARCMVGLIGPDGVGKSSLLSLISGARVIEQGNVMVLGGDMRDPKHRRDVCPRSRVSKLANMTTAAGKIPLNKGFCSPTPKLRRMSAASWSRVLKR